MSPPEARASRAGGSPLPRVEEEVLADLHKRFPAELLESKVVRPRLVEIVVDRAHLVPICQYLKEAGGFAHLGCISAVDWKDHYESVYHIENYDSGCVVQLNARIPHDDPKIASVCSLWNAANFHEREAWDLMGIVYEGHPNLVRILLPDDFKFHPLRKDFPQEVDRQYVSRRKLKGGK